ncbi:MAG TPA: hypothetical protein VGN23_09055 [Verrucomicrobiae bacterium]|jgi:hypothetical protein
MKKHLSLLVAAALAAGTLSLCAQFGGGPPTPQMSGGMEKLFGNNQSFSADAQIQMNGRSGPVTMSAKMYFDKGTSRTEMDMSQMKGASIPPQAMAQMQSMGLDKMVNINQMNSHVMDMIYPDAQAYTEMTVSAPPAGATNASVTLTPLGNETMAGHPCVKNKALVSDGQGTTNEFTVWNATDLKNFPVQIVMNNADSPMTFTFQNVSLTKPDASLFTPPSSFTKYDSMQEMMQAVVMKKMGGGLGGMMPGGRPPQ